MLSDHQGSYFSPGTYPVAIQKLRFFEANSGTPGVEFTVGDGRKSSKIAFWLSEKALPRLAAFAESCGITVQQMRTIDEHNQNTFNVFLGKRFKAVVEKGEPGKDGKRYSEIVDWLPIDAAASPLSASPAPASDAHDKVAEMHQARHQQVDSEPEPAFSPGSSEPAGDGDDESAIPF